LKVINIVGARPNFVKIAPTIRELNKRKDTIEPLLVNTGQHYDQNMSDNLFKQLEILEPDINLGVGSLSHANPADDRKLIIHNFADRLNIFFT
jgi:UDP-N-acetylglucosamine 2-epimerase (non-hydrolysing)